jgi:hypothetical protein
MRASVGALNAAGRPARGPATPARRLRGTAGARAPRAGSGSPSRSAATGGTSPDSHARSRASTGRPARTRSAARHRATMDAAIAWVASRPRASGSSAARVGSSSARPGCPAIASNRSPMWPFEPAQTWVAPNSHRPWSRVAKNASRSPSSVSLASATPSSDSSNVTSVWDMPRLVLKNEARSRGIGAPGLRASNATGAARPTAATRSASATRPAPAIARTEARIAGHTDPICTSADRFIGSPPRASG